MSKLVLAVAGLAALVLAMSPASAHSNSRMYVTPQGAIAAGTGAANVAPSNCDGSLPVPSMGGGCFDHSFGASTTFTIKIADGSGLKVPAWVVQRNSSNTTIGYTFYCLGPAQTQSVIKFPSTTRVIVYVTLGDGCASQPAGAWGQPTSGTITLGH